MKPLLVFPIADPHVGSTVGLHPNYVKKNGEWITVDEAGGWYYKNNPNYYLNSKQIRIWRHFENAVNWISEMRKQKDFDMLIMLMGDVIDGNHHQTHQITTPNEAEQALAFVEIMKWVNERVNFTAGQDKLIVIEGTESHTRDNEEVIAQMLPAEKFKGGDSCIPFLEIEIQGKLCWFYHHGVQAGYSWTAGQSLYNYLRKIYVDRRMNVLRPPDLIVTADKHKTDYQVYRHNGHELHGVILPPFQDKTRFTNRLPTAITAGTKIGISPIWMEGGKITVLNPYLTEMPIGEVLTW